MADDINDKEDKFDFTAEGETLGYISLAQARLLAMQTARESPGEYGGRFRDVPMAFDIAEASEDDDYYIVTLGVRPQGDFAGTPGQEQFFIGKEGEVAHRQVLSLPKSGSGGRRLAAIAAGVLVAVVGIAAIAGFAVANSGPGTSPPSTPAPPPTEIVLVIPPTNTAAPANTPPPTVTPVPTATATTAPASTLLPTQAPLSTYTPFPTSTPRPTFTPFPTSTALPTYTPLPTATPRPTFTPFPTPTALPTYTPLPTATPRPTFTPFPTFTPLPTYTVFPTASPIPTVTPVPTLARRVVSIVAVATRQPHTPTPVPTAAPVPVSPGSYLGYIPLIDAQVTEMKFFESPVDITPYGQRLYADTFDQTSPRYIAWELTMSFPPPALRVDFLIDAIYYLEDGSEFGRHSAEMYVESWWDNASQALGQGWTDPGNWESGNYRVDLFVQGSLVARGEFQVK